jgi:tetratricopeptide (TPR) repeat protein
VAYANISFCQYKLGQYHESIESANDAIAEDSTYKKAYYRRYMAYKELPDSEYEVFVNIHLLLKYSDTMD